MQLPRGTFRTIRKGVKLGVILNELAASRFTGISTISSASGSGTLVFKSGACVLAKIQNQYGDRAWEAAVAQQDMIADTALSDLDNAQLQLALDFNKKALITPARQGIQKPVSPPADSGAAAVPERPRPASPAARGDRKDREFIKTTLIAHGAPVAPPAGERNGQLSSPPPQVTRDQPPDESGQSPAEKDLDTFETMDLDDVAQKIRKDCKIILKQLQLDHLTEK